MCYFKGFSPNHLLFPNAALLISKVAGVNIYERLGGITVIFSIQIPI